MGEALRILLLRGSSYTLNPPGGKAVYLLRNEGKTIEEELIRASFVDEKIPYPYLNPLQTVFYKFYREGNALIASPTSSGKSLLAYLFMRNYKGKIVYTAPTRSLVREKFLEFKSYYPNQVEMRTGETILENFKESRARVIFSTYEHLAHAFRNKPSWINGLSALVIDEVHQITKRWILEEVITTSIKKDIPMLCLSATIPGLEDLIRWIRPRLVIESSWRPVPLIREVKSLTSFSPITKIEEKEDYIASRLLAAIFHLRQREENLILFVPKKETGWRILQLASKEKIGIMNQTLPFDVEDTREPEIAFHNADVPKEEREEIEKAFRDGKLRILIATQTLAYGVNLPADRVVILVKHIKKREDFKLIPDTLDILQMEGRAGRFGIREIGYSNILVYGIKEEKLEEKLSTALNKPLHTAIMEEGIDDAFLLFLLLAYLYEGDNPEAYLRSTYSFWKVSKSKINKGEEFLRERGYIRRNKLTEKGMFCVKSGIPPTSFEEFLNRTTMDIPLMASIRPLLYTKRFDGLFSFLKNKERFEEDLLSVKGMLYPCGRRCVEDNTYQFLFYAEGITAKYSNIKNPPGEFSYLSTDALHLLRTLKEINREGFYRFSDEDMLRIVHSVKYGIDPQYASLSGIKGIGHIRANLLKEAFDLCNIEPPGICSPIEILLDFFERKEFSQALLESIIKYRDLDKKRAKEEVKKIINILENNLKGYMIDDKILLAFWLFEECHDALKKKKRELVELLIHRIKEKWN